MIRQKTRKLLIDDSALETLDNCAEEIFPNLETIRFNTTEYQILNETNDSKIFGNLEATKGWLLSEIALCYLAWSDGVSIAGFVRDHPHIQLKNLFECTVLSLNGGKSQTARNFHYEHDCH